MEFKSRWTSTLILARTINETLSLHWGDWKLTLVQINERRRKLGINMINGRWTFSLSRFHSEELSYPVRWVQCTLVACFKSFLWLTWELFCRWVENCFRRWTLLSCSVSLSIPSYFCLGFCRRSLQAKWVVCRRTSITAQLVLILHSHDRHAYSSLVAVIQNYLISLTKRYSRNPLRYLLLYLKWFLSLLVSLRAVSKLFL